MRKLMLSLVCWCLAQSAFAQAYYTKEDSATVVRLLSQVSKQKSAPANLPLYFARQFLGRPYVAHTLELFDKERLVVNTRQLDCTTLVELVTALTLCTEYTQSTQKEYTKYMFTQFLSVLTSLRYRNGVLAGYTSRLHYFTDWILDNYRMGYVAEVQRPAPPFTAVQEVHVSYMSTHPQNYKALKAHPEWVQRIASDEAALTGKRFRYIPKSKVGDNALMRKAVRDGDIIAITCDKPGLDIAHLGFAVWQKDGLHLLNASMIHHKVVEEPMTLYQYLRKHPSHTGIRIIRINH